MHFVQKEGTLRHQHRDQHGQQHSIAVWHYSSSQHIQDIFAQDKQEYVYVDVQTSLGQFRPAQGICETRVPLAVNESQRYQVLVYTWYRCLVHKLLHLFFVFRWVGRAFPHRIQ